MQQTKKIPEKGNAKQDQQQTANATPKKRKRAEGISESTENIPRSPNNIIGLILA